MHTFTQSDNPQRIQENTGHSPERTLKTFHHFSFSQFLPTISHPSSDHEYFPKIILSLIRFDLIIYVSAVRVLFSHIDILKISLQVQSHTVLGNY